jgi:hypothetical protein
MPVSLTLLDYHYLCLGHFRSFSVVKEKEIRRKERRKGKESQVYRVGLEKNL